MQAEALVQLGRLAEACGHYEQFLLHHDQHTLAARALFRWGECCYRTGNRPDALRLLRQFCAQQKTHELNAYALPYLGQLLAASAEDDTPEAELVLQRALTRFPQGELADECHLQLAILYYRQQRYEACCSHVDSLLQQFPRSPRRTQATYWRAAACLAAEELAAAAGAFQQVAESTTAGELRPAALFFRAECYRRQGRGDEAAQQFLALLDSHVSSTWQSKSLIGLMRVAQQQEDWEALDRWAHRIEQDFANEEAYRQAGYLRAETLLRRQLYVEAIPLLQRLIDDEPKGEPADTASTAKDVQRASVGYLLAVAHLGNQQPAEALAVLEPFLRNRLPANRRAQFALIQAIALSDQGNNTLAIRALRETLAEKPTREVADRCRLKLLRCLLADNRVEAAASVLSDWPLGPESAPTRGLAAGELAEVAYSRGDYAHAATSFRQLLEAPVSAEDQARGLSGLAWSEHQLGNQAEAEQAFAELIERFPQDRHVAEAWLARAGLWEQQGQTEAADEAWAQVIARSDNPRHIASARLQRARRYERAARYAEAIDELDQILTLGAEVDQLDQVHYLRGWVLRQSQRPTDAAAEFQVVHDGFPRSPCWADATYRLAERAYQAQQWIEADRLLQELLATELSESASRFAPFAVFLQGRMAIAQGNWQAASSLMCQVLNDHPASDPAADASFWWAESLYQLEDYSAAAKQFRAATEATETLTAPWTSIVPLRQAQILAAQGEWSEALTAAQSLLEEPSLVDRRFEAEFVVGRALLALARLDEVPRNLPASG